MSIIVALPSQAGPLLEGDLISLVQNDGIEHLTDEEKQEPRDSDMDALSPLSAAISSLVGTSKPVDEGLALGAVQLVKSPKFFSL